MRIRILPVFLFLAVSASFSLAASPEVAPAPTVPVAAAEAGKDVVHQLSNAFAKVFETVAPSVVIIEISKKNEANEALKGSGVPIYGNPGKSGPLALTLGPA